MPSTITHAYFGKDLYNKLPNSIKKNINQKRLMMFSQNTDSLMFYNIYNILPGKSIRNLQKIAHTTKINPFFNNLITYIKENNYYKDSDCLNFLYGFISHFCLDSRAHPYIVYKTGLFNKDDKSTYKYNGYHAYMEAYIDNYYLIKNNHSKKINISKFCFDKNKFSNKLNNAINYSFYKTYNVKGMDKIYYKSLIQMKNFITLFRIDNTGIKVKLYKLIDKITKESSFRFQSLSYYQDDYEKYNFLNNNHSKWYYFSDKNISSTSSFEDIYDEALNEALSIIKEIDLYFNQNKKIDINNLFKNRSYLTGLDCNIKGKENFFEF